MDVMTAIRSRQMGIPVFAGSPDPGLQGLTPGIYPGTITDPVRGGMSALGGIGVGGNGGTTALVILGLLVLALVGFNVSTRAFQA